MLSREEMARRAAREVPENGRVVLGPGLASEVAAFLPEGAAVVESGHADVAVIEVREISSAGDVAGSGTGAAALIARAERLVALVPPAADGALGLVAECSLPVEAKAADARVVTEAAVLDVTFEGLCVRELAHGVTARDVQARSSAPLVAGPDLGPVRL